MKLLYMLNSAVLLIMSASLYSMDNLEAWTKKRKYHRPVGTEIVLYRSILDGNKIKEISFNTEDKSYILKKEIDIKTKNTQFCGEVSYEDEDDGTFFDIDTYDTIAPEEAQEKWYEVKAKFKEQQEKNLKNKQNLNV